MLVCSIMRFLMLKNSTRRFCFFPHSSPKLYHVSLYAVIKVFFSSRHEIKTARTREREKLFVLKLCSRLARCAMLPDLHRKSKKNERKRRELKEKSWESLKDFFRPKTAQNKFFYIVSSRHSRFVFHSKRLSRFLFVFLTRSPRKAITKIKANVYGSL